MSRSERSAVAGEEKQRYEKDDDDDDDDDDGYGTNDDDDNDDDDDETIMIQSNPPLPAYLAEMFGELYERDGLLVLGRGLGLLNLMAAFLRFYADVDEGHAAIVRESVNNDNDNHCNAKEEKQGTKGKAKAKTGSSSASSSTQQNASTIIKPPLIFVIGLKDKEHQALVSILETWGTPPAFLPKLVTNESGQGRDRLLIYDQGGIFCITSRILIVDLLTNHALAKDIDGMLVAHAENVTEQSTEAFILRIFRTYRSQASIVGVGNSSSSTSMGGYSSAQAPPAAPPFIKAFSENAESLQAGFAKVDKILKALHVRRLYLYPRFHTIICDELEKNQPHCEQIHVELTPRMKEIQATIAAAIQTCIGELKSSTSLIEWNDLSVENCVTTNIELSISRQLEHDWHRLTPKTKALVHDLRTLRSLFNYLLSYDCVSFWKLINNIKTMSHASRNPSMWLLSPAADMLFRRAKERIYKIKRNEEKITRASKHHHRKEGDGTASLPADFSPVARLVPVLEENPKWKLLKNLLSEIQTKHHEKNSKQGKSVVVAAAAAAATVLVMVKDGRTLETLRGYLVDGRERIMTLRWFFYLEQFNDRSRCVAKNSGGSSNLSEESRLLLEEEGRTRYFLFGRQSSRGGGGGATKKKRNLNEVPQYMKKRRRIAQEKSRGEQTMQSEDLAHRAVLDEAVEETEHGLQGADGKAQTESNAQTVLKEAVSSEDEEDRCFKVRSFEESRVIMKAHTNVEGEDALLMLNDIKPDYVILYDAEPSFIRALEVYSCMNPSSDPLQVYFMLFAESSEDKNFRKALEREQNAFERLIQHKKTMPLPVNTLTSQEMQLAGPSAGSYAGGSLPLSMDTRSGKGKQKNDEKRDIAVDVREFRSALPSILHQGGMRLAPVTLTVGDFVLSNVHCMEQKKISDLFMSFASGLYAQAQSISKH